MSPAISPSLAEFRRLVVEDAALFAELQAAPNNEAFFALAVQLGQQRGFAFTVDDVKAALVATRRAWMERHIT